MVFPRSGVTAALAAFALIGSALSVPLGDKLNNLSLGARDLLKRSIPAAPRFAAYSDKWVWPPPAAAELKGFNVYILSFWLTSGPVDMATAWTELTNSQRTSYLKEYNDAGISLIVSAFGETDTPTSAGTNAITVANDLAKWVKQYHLQGVDIDYEDFDAFDNAAGIAEPWVISLTQQLRTHLPQGEYILTHAPVAPWFSPSIWSGGGYMKVYEVVGDLIDWFNIQFYSQGTEYTTCQGLLWESSSEWPESALFQIANNGVDRNKLVIGKPATQSDATGFMHDWDLHTCVAEAHSKGWDGGVMVWEYPDAGSYWITKVRGNTWPISG